MEAFEINSGTIYNKMMLMVVSGEGLNWNEVVIKGMFTVSVLFKTFNISVR